MDDLRFFRLKHHEISNVLNSTGNSPPTKKKYTDQLVKRSLFKFKNRLKRENEIEVV